MSLPPRHALEEKARQSAARLIDLVQAAVLESPHVIIAIERLTPAFVAEEQRRDLKRRLAYLDAKEIAAIEALIAQFEREAEEPTDPPGESA